MAVTIIQSTMHGHVVRQPRTIRTETHISRNTIAMKTLLIGMLLAQAVAPIALSEVDDSAIAREFSWSMVGGTIGSLICICLWKPVDTQEMGRNAAGNLLIAAAFGPSVCAVVAAQTGFPLNLRLIIPVTATLGITGVALFRYVWPKVIQVLGSGIQASIARMFGITPPKDDDKPL